jgi:membrane protein YqaA with SNARE-associated domain
LLTGIGGGLLAASMWPTLLFGVLGMALAAILELMAINPLKHRQYRGWQLMLAAVTLQVIFGILQAILTNTISSIVGALLSFVIGAYLLAQVHSYFVKNGQAAHLNRKK